MAILRPWQGLVALALASCTSPNPAFDASGGGSGGGSRSTGDAEAGTAQPSSDGATSAVSVGGSATSAGSTSVDSTAADGTTELPPPASTGDTPSLRALLVTQAGDAAYPLDATLLAVLEDMGAEVVLVDDDASMASDAQDVDVVVISETVFGTAVGAKFRDVERPVVAIESLVWDDMAMAAGGGWTQGTVFAIVDPGHPIAAGLAGEVPILLPDLGSGMSPTTPPPSAQVIARVPGPGLVTVFAYAAGEPMMGGVLAPAARVGFGADVDGNGTTDSTADLSPQGVQMFVAAIEWCTQ